MHSKYAQRMVRLSSKIFGEYRRPPLPDELKRERCWSSKPRDAWHSFHYRNENTIRKLAMLPLDLDKERNPDYYPPHPQHIKLISTLREYGLFRDEHMDFNEEMTRLKALRGKFGRQKGGGKRAQLKSDN